MVWHDFFQRAPQRPRRKLGFDAVIVLDRVWPCSEAGFDAGLEASFGVGLKKVRR